MKIVIMLSNDTIFKPSLLYNLLLSKCNIVCVVEVGGKGDRKNYNKILREIKFWGFRGVFFLGIYKFLKIILSVLPLPTFLKITSNIKTVCKFFNKEYKFVCDVNNQNFLKYLKKIHPDIIFSFQHQIFKKEILSIPSIACLNCHPAKLPIYRGIKPIFWAMIDEADCIGVTVHTMNEDIDAGRIISQATFPLVKGFSLFQNYFSSYLLSNQVILDSFDKIKNKPINEFTIIPTNSPYYKYPSKKDIKKFYAKGLKLI